jgi:hypothetical protein
MGGEIHSARVVRPDAHYPKEITGILSPITPVTPKLYAQHKFPWFSLYDNFQSDISSVSEALAALKSVSSLDEDKAHSNSISNALVDPDDPGYCTAHIGQIITCVFRPCGHTGCAGCLGAAMLNGSKCTTCNAHIEKFVGTKQPIPVTVSQSPNNDTKEWSVSVIDTLARQTRDRATVEIIQFDPRERVSPLFRANSQVADRPAPLPARGAVNGIYAPGGWDCFRPRDPVTGETHVTHYETLEEALSDGRSAQ